MKKFMLFAFVLAIAFSAFAMADSTGVNWRPFGDYNSVGYSGGGDFDVLYGDSFEFWGVQADFEPVWEYSPNDTLFVGVNRFDSFAVDEAGEIAGVDFATRVNGLRIVLMTDDETYIGDFDAPGGFFVNGVYTFIGNDAYFNDEYSGISWDRSIPDGIEVAKVALMLSFDAIDDLNNIFRSDTVVAAKGDQLYQSEMITQGEGFGFSAGVIKAPEPITVPEPISAAYALVGLGSLIGIKRRIKK